MLLPARLAAFRALEALSHLRTPPAQPASAGAAADAGVRWLWVYATTIGELNAIDPLLAPLQQALGNPPVALISNHPHYAEAYLRKHPAARVEVIDGSTAQARALAHRCPPRLLVVAEIPCLLQDAPCRFSYATLRVARAVGARAVLVNGWLYGYQPPSRMDHLERRLFGRDYVRAFDLALVQTDDVRARLLQAGADPQRVEVTGNLKFDAMAAAAARLQPGVLGRALQAYADGPVVVAGSVTETEDQRQILQAFATLHAAQPLARLVLAPRHPENRERMAALQLLLQASGLGHQYRSRTEPAQLLASPVLVLDTMGELRECYAAAALAYVGTDHNVLEPLSFGCPTYVSGHWEPTYPSHPVYLQTLAAGLIESVNSGDELGERWSSRARDLVCGTADASRDRIRHTLEGACGSTERTLQALRTHRLLA